MRVATLVVFLSCIGMSWLAAQVLSQPRPEQSLERYGKMATADFSRRVEEAAKKGETWPKVPMLVALKFVGEEGECSSRTVVIHRREGGSSATVAVTDDGCWDDAIQAKKFTLRLAMGPDGTWKIAEALRAWRCWRGPARFSTEPCP